MYKYHSIEQFRNCIKEIQYQYKDKELPTLLFNGTVKLHGTNAGVELPANIPQSRNQILTEQNPNHGFWNFWNERKEIFQEIYNSLNINLPIIIYGEWAGKGIQHGIGISQVDKAFYIFGIKVITGEDSYYWLKEFSINKPESNILNLRAFKQFQIEIDFNNPQLIQDQLQELTLAVEQECPVAKEFGIFGIGEGIVWEHITEEGNMFCFKVKGNKHSSSKVKILAAVDVEKLTSIQEFVEYVLTDSRLEQAYFECNEPKEMKDIGLFLKWINVDILKEEQDTLDAMNLTIRDVSSALSKIAKQWFINKIN